jgi:predicted dehydrogenase
MLVKDETKIEVGVVGLGKMGVMHACLLSTFGNVKVKALCDKSRLMRAVAKNAFQNTTVTSDLSKFAKLDLDAIYVLTPIPSHYPILKQIYLNNLAPNVFVEKTLSHNYSRSHELTELAEKNGGVNMVGYMKRFGVTFNYAKNLLEQEALGELKSFEAYAYSSDFADEPEGSEGSKARGGVVEDLGSHMVDLAIWLFGDLAVTDAKSNNPISAVSEDDVSFGVSAADGVTGKFVVSWRKAGYRMPEFGIRISGTKGSLYVNDDEVQFGRFNSEQKTWFRHDLNDSVGFFLGGAEYWRENQHFLQAVNLRTPTSSDFSSALRVDLLLEQVRRKLH